jgi:hypothetical protein
MHLDANTHTGALDDEFAVLSLERDCTRRSRRFTREHIAGRVGVREDTAVPAVQALRETVRLLAEVHLLVPVGRKHRGMMPGYETAIERNTLSISGRQVTSFPFEAVRFIVGLGLRKQTSKTELTRIGRTLSHAALRAASAACRLFR